MEPQTKLYISAIPVLLALTWVFLGPRFGDFSHTLWNKGDGLPSTSTPPKGHMQPFGYHAEKEKGIVELDEFPDPETFYRDYMRKSVPMIVRGGVKHWPAVEKWKSEDYLREEFGQSAFNVMFKNVSVDKHHFAHMHMHMEDYLDHYKNHKLYLDSAISRDMAKDLTIPKLYGCDFYVKMMKEFQIFFNAGWSSTDLHLDITETFFAQVTGQRQWILTTPREGLNTYSDDFGPHTGISQLDVESVDILSFPNVTSVDVYNITANPGDIIYVPEGWWHQVRAKGPNPPNIAVAIFLHWLNCQHVVESQTDAEYVEKCIQVREKQPLEMKCDLRFDEAPMDQMAENLKHLEAEPLVAFDDDDRTIEDLFDLPFSMLKSGYEMPDMGLSLGSFPTEDLETAVRYALKVGYRLFDTDFVKEADSALGSVLANDKRYKREDVFIIVKIPYDQLEKDATNRLIENSMERLQTDYLDLVLFQAPPCKSKDEECGGSSVWEGALKALEALYAKGSIRSLGAMDFKLKVLQRLLKVTKVPISVVHSHFDIIKRRKKLRDFCAKNGIRFMAHSIFGEQWVGEFNVKNPILENNKLKVTTISQRTTIQGTLIHWALINNVTVAAPAHNLFHISLNQKALALDLGEDGDTLENLPHID